MHNLKRNFRPSESTEKPEVTQLKAEETQLKKQKEIILTASTKRPVMSRVLMATNVKKQGGIRLMSLR